jgi:hypothetical protein
MSPHRVFPIGSLVSLTGDEDVVRLAQVETHQVLPDGQMQAAGRVLGALGPNGLDDSAMEVFGSATVAAADPKKIDSLNSGAGASLEIGSPAARSSIADSSKHHFAV